MVGIKATLWGICPIVLWGFPPHGSRNRPEQLREGEAVEDYVGMAVVQAARGGRSGSAPSRRLYFEDSRQPACVLLRHHSDLLEHPHLVEGFPLLRDPRTLEAHDELAADVDLLAGWLDVAERTVVRARQALEAGRLP